MLEPRRGEKEASTGQGKENSILVGCSGPGGLCVQSRIPGVEALKLFISLFEESQYSYQLNFTTQKLYTFLF
jgi:hypothetical protein